MCSPRPRARAGSFLRHRVGAAKLVVDSHAPSERPLPVFRPPKLSPLEVECRSVDISPVGTRARAAQLEPSARPSTGVGGRSSPSAGCSRAGRGTTARRRCELSPDVATVETCRSAPSAHSPAGRFLAAPSRTELAPGCPSLRRAKRAAFSAVRAVSPSASPEAGDQDSARRHRQARIRRHLASTSLPAPPSIGVTPQGRGQLPRRRSGDVGSLGDRATARPRGDRPELGARGLRASRRGGEGTGHKVRWISTFRAPDTLGHRPSRVVPPRPTVPSLARTRPSATRTFYRSTSHRDRKGCGSPLSRWTGLVERGVASSGRQPPHEPFAFWEWLLAEAKVSHPDLHLPLGGLTRPK